jgi:transcriptional regulator with XRE-family HTH domain
MPRTKVKAPATASEAFGRQVKVARKLLHLSQADLANRLSGLGIDKPHQTTVARLETGGRRVSVDDALAVAAALGVSPLHLFAASFTQDTVPVTPKLEAGPQQMRRWLAGQVQLPSLDEDAFFELVPDEERLARQRRSIQVLQRCFSDFRDAWIENDHRAMRDAVSDMRRELERQDADLDREERVATRGERDG